MIFVTPIPILYIQTNKQEKFFIKRLYNKHNFSNTLVALNIIFRTMFVSNVIKKYCSKDVDESFSYHYIWSAVHPEAMSQIP